MGYEPQRKIYNLDFKGTQHEGLEVKMRGLIVDEELELDELRGKEGGGRRVFELMAGLLVEWNVTNQGQPVPATFDGVRKQESTFIMDILNALQTATSGVPDPLHETSPSGETSPAPPIPMAPLSENPESYAVPA